MIVQRKESVEQPEQVEEFKVKPVADRRVSVHEEQSVTLERPREEVSQMEFSQDITIKQTKTVTEEYVYLESPEVSAERIVRLPGEQPEQPEQPEESFTVKPAKKQPEKLDSIDVTVEKVELKPEVESPREEKFTLTKPRKSISEPVEEQAPDSHTIQLAKKAPKEEEQVAEVKITTKRKKSKPTISEDQQAEAVIIKPAEEAPESPVEVFKIQPKKSDRKLSVEEEFVALEQPKSEADESHEFTIRQTAVQEDQQTYEAAGESQTIKLEKSKKSKSLDLIFQCCKILTKLLQLRITSNRKFTSQPTSKVARLRALRSSRPRRSSKSTSCWRHRVLP